MIKYNVVPKNLTVDQFIEVLTELKKKGFGEEECQIFDGDSGSWETITGFTYNNYNIRFYSDEL